MSPSPGLWLVNTLHTGLWLVSRGQLGIKTGISSAHLSGKTRTKTLQGFTTLLQMFYNFLGSRIGGNNKWSKCPAIVFLFSSDAAIDFYCKCAQVCSATWEMVLFIFPAWMQTPILRISVICCLICEAPPGSGSGARGEPLARRGRGNSEENRGAPHLASHTRQSLSILFDGMYSLG